MKLMMLDLETLGTRPDAPVFEVGALTFDPNLDAEGGNGVNPVEFGTFHEYIDPTSDILKGALPEVGTCVWWQSQAAQGRVGIAGRAPKPVLQDLFDFFDQEQPDWIVANSPSFDCVIIETMARRWGMEVPWSFRRYLDCRSVSMVHELIFTKPEKSPVSHNALDDCRNQATRIAAELTALVRLGGSFDG